MLAVRILNRISLLYRLDRLELLKKIRGKSHSVVSFEVEASIHKRHRGEVTFYQCTGMNIMVCMRSSR